MRNQPPPYLPQCRSSNAPADDAGSADLIVLCGVTGEPEIEVARRVTLPVLVFDGVQGSDLDAARDVWMALPFAPRDGVVFDHMVCGTERARRAAQMVAVEPPVWLWRDHGWTLRPERAL